MTSLLARSRWLFACVLACTVAVAGIVSIPPVRERLRELRRYLQLQPLYPPTHFDFRQLDASGVNYPTTIEFGPDGRLYVAEVSGLIKILDVERSERGFRVGHSESIRSVYELPNHDDSGTPNPEVVGRLITGMTVEGSADAPVIYVASSDPRLSSARIDTNSGVISRLDRLEQKWIRTDLVRGLPRSRLDHAPHGVVLDRARNKLFVSQGGNTNAGAASSDFFDLPEYALAAAILEIDLAAIEDAPYDLPTLDDEDRPGPDDGNDPFGGNGGKNQAIEPADGPVRVYATGIRNAFDLLLTDRGLYTIDNGANQNRGGRPKIDSVTGRIDTEPVEGGRKTRNQLHLIRDQGYYGHPNPVRADAEFRFNQTQPQSPVRMSRPHEASRRHVRLSGRRLAVFPRSANGLTEYRGGLDHPPYDGSLLAVSLGQRLFAIELDEFGARVVEKRIIAEKLGFGSLDVTARAHDESFPGTIWISDHSGSRIWILDPQRKRSWTFTQLIRDANEWFWMTVARRAAY